MGRGPDGIGEIVDRRSLEAVHVFDRAQLRLCPVGIAVHHIISIPCVSAAQTVEIDFDPFFSSQGYVGLGYQLSGDFHLKRFYLLAIDIGEVLHLCICPDGKGKKHHK